MTWVEHSVVGVGLYGVSRLSRKPLSLSLILVGSTVLMDLDHLWFRIAAATVLPENPSITLGFWLNSGTWTHSVAYAVGGSWLACLAFRDRHIAFRSLAAGAVLHLAGDWAYRQMLFGMGLSWLWPLSATLF